MFKLFKQLKNFLCRPAHEQFIALEALVYLIWIKYELYRHPFSYLAKKYSLYPIDMIPTDTADIQTVKTIGWAVRRLSERLPWESLCLVQAMSVQRMLVRRQIASILYLGVAKEGETNALKAHAWVKYSDFFIVGKAGHECFTIVSKLTWKVDGSR